jgi:hypothetical protein
MPCTSSKRTYPAAVVLATVTIALVVISGCGDGVSGGSSAEDTSATNENPLSLSDMVAVFRRPQVANDRIPGGDPVEGLEQAGDRQPEENPRLARRVGEEAWDMYAWPMRDGVCHQWGAYGGCTGTDTLQKYGFTPSFSYRKGPPAQWTLDGVVRDGVEQVVVRLRDGSQEIVPARANAFKKTVWTEPVAIEVRLPDGTERTIEIPASPS